MLFVQNMLKADNDQNQRRKETYLCFSIAYLLRLSWVEFA